MIEVSTTSVADNYAYASGGGMMLGSKVGGTINVTDTTVSGNSTPGNIGGVGIYATGGTATLTNVTVSGNSAGTDGGGVYVDADPTGSVTLTNVTVTGNTAVGTGGGIRGNLAAAGTAVLRNTLVSGNTAATGADVYAIAPYLFDSDHGLIQDTASAAFVNDLGGTISGLDPLLGALANNGGTTLTHLPASTSPALENGTATGCPATDQTGTARPIGTVCDIGAVETASTNVPPKVSSTSPANNATYVSFTTTIGINFTESVDVAAATFSLECPSGSPVAFTTTPALPASGITGVTLTPDSDIPRATCQVTVTAANVLDSNLTLLDGNGDGIGGDDYAFSFTTGEVPPPSGPGVRPNTPGPLTATPVDQTTINLVWTDNSGLESGYRIYRDGVEIPPPADSTSTLTVPADTESYTDTGLTCGTLYNYTLVAVSSRTQEEESTPVTDSARTDACDVTDPGEPGDPGGTTTAARLTNTSVRCHVHPGSNMAISGFVITGSGDKTVLIRGMATSLSPADFDLNLTLMRRSVDNQVVSWNTVTSNDNWGDDALTAANISGLTPNLHPRESTDAGILTVLSPGVYTALAEVNGPSGVGVLGVDDLDDPATSNSWLSNFSGRCLTDTGVSQTIVGFVVEGSGTLELALRGMLVAGLSDPAFNPAMDLYKIQPGVGGEVIHSSSDGDMVAFNGLGKPHLALRDSRDAGLLLGLPAGVYTLNMFPTGVPGIGVLGVDLVP